ncbi:MAG: GNAT family N-acetyltransferase [Clostridiaceae bacterium]|nr:GNAT family N-acetyltransferase [Clostridiaceae bacterium]
MIRYKELPWNDAELADLYDSIEMKVHVKAIYEVIIEDLSGISFHKTAVEPYVKDFTFWEKYSRWKTEFDISNWHFYVAFDEDYPIGGAALCHKTPQIHMLDGREDLGVLWDIRVDSMYKHHGIGQCLFDRVRENAKALGLKQLKIECQNNNVPAVNFYLKQGAHIGAINKYAYYKEKYISDEVQLLLYLDL